MLYISTIGSFDHCAGKQYDLWLLPYPISICARWEGFRARLFPWFYWSYIIAFPILQFTFPYTAFSLSITSNFHFWAASHLQIFEAYHCIGPAAIIKENKNTNFDRADTVPLSPFMYHLIKIGVKGPVTRRSFFKTSLTYLHDCKNFGISELCLAIWPCLQKSHFTSENQALPSRISLLLPKIELCL